MTFGFDTLTDEQRALLVDIVHDLQINASEFALLADRQSWAADLNIAAIHLGESMDRLRNVTNESTRWTRTQRACIAIGRFFTGLAMRGTPPLERPRKWQPPTRYRDIPRPSETTLDGQVRSLAMFVARMGWPRRTIAADHPGFLNLCKHLHDVIGKYRRGTLPP